MKHKLQHSEVSIIGLNTGSPYPADTEQHSNVASTSMRCNDVTMTSQLGNLLCLSHLGKLFSNTQYIQNIMRHVNMAKICRKGYHEEKAENTDSHKTAKSGPQVFGENGYFFSGSWGALVIILGDLGSKLIVLGI